MVSSRPLLFMSIPGLALMLGVIWYRRRKMVRCDNSEGEGDEPEINIKSNGIPNSNRTLKSSKSLEILSSKAKNTEGNSESNKYGKSAPIDILPNRKKSPVYLTDKQIDTEILKIKIRDSEYKTLRSIEESSESISPLSLPDSVHKRNYLSPRAKKMKVVEPVVIKATVSAKISPKNSFLESAYTEECPLQSLNSNKNMSEPVVPEKTEIVETKTKLVDEKMKEVEKEVEQIELKVETRPQSTASPPLSICSVHSADSGKGSSLPHAEEQSIMNYEFLLPDSLVGQLYGRKRLHLNQLRAKAGAKISLKKHPLTEKIKICIIEGTQKQINSALSLIRQKLPLKRYPNLTLERVHFAEPQAIVPLNEVHRSCLELSLIEGINNDVIVTSVSSGGHLFVQQPLHPSHPTLSILQNCLNKTYSSGEAPGLPDMTDDAICVGNYLGSWYRVQIVSKTPEENENACVVKFLDYGGYAVMEKENMKQIRADFLVTPFQAIEAMLSNIKPTGCEWSDEATTVLYELTKGIVLQAQVVGYTNENIPEIYLYACLGPNNVIFINKELVARKLAKWTE